MGENDFKAPRILTNDEAYKYGGEGGVRIDSERARQERQRNIQKQGEYGQQQQGLYNRGNQQMDRGNDAFAQQGLARFRQTQMQDQMAARARGQYGSIAQQQADRQMAQLGRVLGAQGQDLEASQASAAASARGPAALALAQQQQANNVAAGYQNIARTGANATQSISEAAQVNAANEQLQAERAAFGAAGSIRQGDHGAAGLGYQSAGTAFGAGAQSGQLGVQHGQLGLGYGQLEHGIKTAQLNASTQQQAVQGRNDLGVMQVGAGVSKQNADQDQEDYWNTFDAVVGGGGALLGGATSIFSDEQAKLPMVIGGEKRGALDANTPNLARFVPPPPSNPNALVTYGDTVQPEGGFELVPGQSPHEPTEAAQPPPEDHYMNMRNALQAADKVEWDRDKSREGAANVLYGEASAPDTSFLDAKPAPTAKKAPAPKATDVPKPEQGKWEKAGMALSDKLVSIGNRQRSPVRSDEMAKDPIGLGPVSAGIEMGGTSVEDPTYDALSSGGGGMDVMGSLARHSKNATRFISNPGAPAMASGMYQKRPMGSGMTQKIPGQHGSGMTQKMPRSDERAKRPAGETLSTKGLGRFREVDDAAMAEANRSQTGYPYAYKDEHLPEEQQQGEANVGPMAQRMAKDPVAGTAVKRDPQSGLLALDPHKMLKVQASGIASLQKQVDALSKKLGKKGRK